jgi:hypothetical protein
VCFPPIEGKMQFDNIKYNNEHVTLIFIQYTTMRYVPTIICSLVYVFTSFYCWDYWSNLSC